MTKRFAAAITCLIIAVMAVLPAYASDNTTGDKKITDAALSFEVYLSAFLEKEFRVWADEQIEWFAANYKNPQQTMEPYRLRSYKVWFDATFGKETSSLSGNVLRSIEYSSVTMTDAQKDQMVLYALIKGLNETRSLSFLELYQDRKGYDRFVNTDGTVETNQMAVSAKEKADADLDKAITTAVVDGADLVITTVMEYQKVVHNVDTKIAEIIRDIMKDLINTATDKIIENIKNKADNDVKKYLVSMASSTLLEVSAIDVDIMYRDIISNEYTDERMKTQAKKIYDYYNSSDFVKQATAACEAEIGKKAEIDEALDDLGMELEKELNSSEIVMIIAFDGLKNVLKKMVEEAIDNMTKTETDKWGSVSPSGELKTSVAKILKDLLFAYIDCVVDSCEREWRKAKPGEYEFDLIKAVNGLTKDDWGKILQNIDLFKFIDNESLKKLMDRKDDQIAAFVNGKDFEGTNLAQRICICLIYWFVKNSGKEIQDQIWEKLAKGESISLSSFDYGEVGDSLLKAADNLFFDIMKVLLKYTKDTLTLKCLQDGSIRNTAGTSGVGQDAAEILKQNQELKKIIDIVSSVSEKAWNFGTEILNLAYQATDTKNGETVIAVAAQKVVNFVDLSENSYFDFVHNLYPTYLNKKLNTKEQPTIGEIVTMLSHIEKVLDYDCQAANEYRAMVDLSRGECIDSLFAKISRGSKVYRWTFNRDRFAKNFLSSLPSVLVVPAAGIGVSIVYATSQEHGSFISYNYQNIKMNGNDCSGFLNQTDAVAEYNKCQQRKEAFKKDYKSAYGQYYSLSN